MVIVPNLNVGKAALRAFPVKATEIDIPEELDLPVPDVVVNTRKGVMVAYEPGKAVERIA